ncbi:ThuA domain-containing protein [Plantactinospora sp. CA-290183]|uniref:ThuA domain-containing protein n=1 Tax=Plantactinospora sp. CA-290183 TaxID=3240006 RepID=UPI003D93432A
MFIPFLERSGYAVRVEESTEIYADAAELADTDLVVQCVTMSQITPEQLAGLGAAVVAGTGFTGWHGGIADSFRASSDYLHLVGGQFATHPGKEPCERRGGPEDNFLPHTVRITDLGREHPITAGIEDFDLVTEQYWVLHDDLIDVLATTTHPTREAPAAPGPTPRQRSTCWGAARRRDDPGAQPRRAGAPERAYRHREDAGRPAPRRNSPVHSSVPGHARGPPLGDVVVADLDQPSGSSAAAGIPGAEAMGVERLLAHPDVRTVLNLTIPAAHAEISLGAIEAGKNVYVEKPLAVTLPDGRSIIDRAASAGVRVGCAPDTVLGTGTQTARAAIDGGLIGRPLSASAVMVTAGHERWHPDPDFYYAPGGGPLLDMGPYYISALVHLLGPVRAVVGAASRLRTERVIGSGPRLGQRIPVEVDSHVTGVLEHANGALSTITTSFDGVATTAAPIEVHGEAGSLAVPDPNHFDGEVRLFALGGPGWRVLEPRAGYANGSRGVGLIDLVTSDARRPPRAGGEVALHVLETMSALLRSAAQGRRVELTTVVERPAPVPLTRVEDWTALRAH